MHSKKRKEKDMKIDTSKITGYSEMSAEDKLKALEGFEFDEPKHDSGETDKLKAALSKAKSMVAKSGHQPNPSNLNIN